MSLMDRILGREERKKNQQTQGGGLPEPQKPERIDLALSDDPALARAALLAEADAKHSRNRDLGTWVVNSGPYSKNPDQFERFYSIKYLGLGDFPDADAYFERLTTRYPLEKLATIEPKDIPIASKQVCVDKKFDNYGSSTPIYKTVYRDEGHVMALAALTARKTVSKDSEEIELIDRAGANIAAALHEDPDAEKHVRDVLAGSLVHKLPESGLPPQALWGVAKESTLYQAYHETLSGENGLLAAGDKLYAELEEKRIKEAKEKERLDKLAKLAAAEEAQRQRGAALTILEEQAVKAGVSAPVLTERHKEVPQDKSPGSFQSPGKPAPLTDFLGYQK